MSEKTVTVVLGVFVVLGVVFFIYRMQWRRAEEQETISRRAFPMEVDSVQSLELETAGQRMEVRRSEDGWRLAHPVQADADAAEVEQLIRFLAGVEAVRVLTDVSANDMDSYGLNDPKRVIRIKTPDREMTLRIGKQSATGTQVYAAGPDAVDRALVFDRSLVRRTDRTVFDLRDKRLFSFHPTEVEQIFFTAGQFDSGVRRTSTGDWLMLEPEWAKADEAVIGELIGRLAGWEAVGFVDDPEELFEEVARIEVKAKGESASGLETLFIGSESEDERIRLVRKEPGGGLVEVDSERYSEIEELVLSLRQRRFFSMESYGVDRIEVKKSGEELFSAGRAADGQWIIESPGPGPAIGFVLQSYLGRLLRTEADLFMDELGELDLYGLDSPRFQVTIEGFGQRESLLVGVDPSSATEAAQVDNLFVKRPEEQTVMLAGEGLAELLFRDFHGMLDVADAPVSATETN